MADNEFDFFHGAWKVNNRRLTADGWEEFPAECTVRKLLGRIGFIDEMVFGDTRLGGHTLGLYDSTKDTWAHYWVSTANGILQPPVYGCAKEMLGDDELDGKPIRVRYVWEVVSDDEIRWEQAFSSASGWETNWIMDCTRVG